MRFWGWRQYGRIRGVALAPAWICWLCLQSAFLLSVTPPLRQGNAGQPESAADDSELTLLEAIRSDHPERLFDLLKEATSVPESRKGALRALARYRLGEFDEAAKLLAALDPAQPDAAFLKGLLLASEGRFSEAEGTLAPVVARPELGLLGFEAGLLHSNVLQQLGRHREAAADIERILPDAPFGKPALRSIQALLQAAPDAPYKKVALGPDHSIPLLADGSLPARTVLSLEPNGDGKLVLFDTGSSLSIFKADVSEQDQNRARALGLSFQANMDFQYAWKPSLDLGGWKLEGIPVGLVNRHSEEAAQLNYEAVFSLPLLRRFFVVFDFPGRKIQLLDERPQQPEGELVSFRYAADQILLPASVNGKPALLLLDTGFGLPSMKFDISWAQELAPPPLPVAPQPQAPPPASKGGKPAGTDPKEPGIPGMPGTPMPALETQITSLKIGKVELTELSVTLDPLRRRLNQSPLAVRIDGILAAPMLQDYVVSIDFGRNEIYLLHKAPAQ